MYIFIKVKLINNDCLPILMLLYIMLYIMLAYLMLLAALSNTVCLHDVFLAFILANAYCFWALSWFIHTQFVYFKYYLALRKVLIFIILCSHRFFLWKGQCALWRNTT